MYISSDTQLAIWVAKNYTVYRTKDAKWYFGGYLNKSKTIFTAQEALPSSKMADSAHDPTAIEHNNYHPQTPDFNSLFIGNIKSLNECQKRTIYKSIINEVAVIVKRVIERL